MDINKRLDIIEAKLNRLLSPPKPTCPVFKSCIFDTPCKHGRCLLLLKKEYKQIIETMEFIDVKCDGSCRQDKG